MPSAGKVRDGGKPGSVYHSYKSLPYNTKLVFWTCGANKLEELFPARNNKPSSKSESTTSSAKFIDHGKVEERKPKLFSISVVDRETPTPK
ncbi:hypothetical protein PHBOTO_006071 [Pseudozyma hubeiensis]|nr:hypothetical protein PHBOTO_006071 [Pseudozyma hubeiensis]